MTAGQGDIAFYYQVFHAEFVGVHADLARDAVHVRFGCEKTLGLARRAHLPSGQIIGVNPRDGNARMLGAVTAAGMGDAVDDRARSKAAISAGVEIGIHLMGNNGAIALDAGLQFHHRRVARRPGKKFFAVFHDHLHRPLRPRGEQIAYRLVDGRALAAEVAADGHGIDTNSVFGNAEGLRHAFLQAVRHLVGRPHLHPLALIDPHHTAMRLQKRLVHSWNSERVFDNQIGLGEADTDIAAGEYVMNESIGRLFQGLGQAFITRHVGMNDRCAFLQSRNRIENRRQLLVFDLNQLQSILGLFERIRRHGGDALAQEAHPILGQNGDVAVAPAVKNPARVLTREHGAHARRLFRARSIDPQDASMRKGAAQRLRPKCAGK